MTWIWIAASLLQKMPKKQMLHELSWQHWRSDITVMLHDCFSAVTWWIKVDSILYFNHLNSCILYFAPNSQSNCKKSIWDTYLQSNLYFVIEIHFKVVDPTLLYGHLDGRVAGLTKTWWDNTIQYNTMRDLYGATIGTVQERRTTVITSQYARSNRMVLSRFLNVLYLCL